MTLAELKIFQVAIILVSATMLYFGIDKFLKREASQSLLKLLTRIIVWGGMATIALFPDLSDQVAEFIGIEDNINAVILTGFLLVFLFIFKILSVVERIEQEISTLTRNQSLKDFERKVKSSHSLSSGISMSKHQSTNTKIKIK